MHDEAVCQSKLRSEPLHHVAMQGDELWLGQTTADVRVRVSVCEPDESQEC
jgi:hypothetical protein